MIKKLFRNRPDFGRRGHYVFYDDSSSDPNYSDSDGLPVRNDKFRGKDLYTEVKQYDLNDAIVGYKMTPTGDSFIKIKELKIENNGVRHRITRNRVRAWIFDDNTFKNISGQPVSITGVGGYDDIETIITNSDFNAFKFFDSSFSTKGEGESLGNVIENSTLVDNLSSSDGDDGNRVYGEFNGFNSSFNIDNALSPPAGEEASSELGADFTNLFAYNLTRQKIYIVIQMEGNAQAWYDSNDIRKRSIQIFSFDPGNLFTRDGGIRQDLNFTYGSSIRYEGFGDSRDKKPGIEAAEKAAWKCTSLKLDISTEQEVQPPSVPIDIERFERSVKPSVELDLNNFEESFLNQEPNQAIYNLYTDYYAGSDVETSEQAVKSNFEPVAITKITSTNEYDLQAYQRPDLDRQFCSAPGEISLDFYISQYNQADYILDGAPGMDNEFAYQREELGYKFYVIDWDDVDDKFQDVEDFLEDIPSDIYELYRKKEDDLYKISDIGTPLYQTYSTPGVKNIKAVLFSHTLDGRIQIVRWKFITIRIFLDIPVNQYPEFTEYCGTLFKTIPWPYTTPIIGGTNLSSDYQISINETISGGKIGDKDIIDELFLIDGQENDELGESIEKFDLEQIRYFNTGVYDMNELLGLDITTLPFDTSDEYLETLPFPEYFEEFDINQDENIDPLDAILWIERGRPDIADYISNEIVIPNLMPPGLNNGIEESEITPLVYFFNQATYAHLYSNSDYWDCRDWNDERIHCFPEKSSVGQIFISDNLDLTLQQDCKIELNCGDKDGNIIRDSGGNGNQGIMIGDYKIKKIQKGRPMRRDSFIKIPKKTTNTDGAL